MLVGADTGQVHGVYLAGEIVERQANERCRRAAEELVDRAAKNACIIRCASLRQNSVLVEPRQQRLLVALALLLGAGERRLVRDEADARALLEIAPGPEAGESRQVVGIRRRQRRCCITIRGAESAVSLALEVQHLRG